ncbi:hypothetical protein [Ehrlichia muris]|uniref:Uncharacterized protein n=1 Tax=Ehrlichia muris AS145 TaxID=1423892 RepID=V9RAA6_9RICK|nr:hypothetical protein [Ehrlichia muris]AHC39719.1 hypothetical protein EMUR_02530 [Ehrlichia muris AS145]
MQLILLPYGDSQLSLFPTKSIHYDKALNVCYTGDPDTDILFQLVGIAEFSQNLYRSKFDDYCIASNPKLERNIVFLYGSNPSGQPVYMALFQPVGLMPSLFQEGVILNRYNLISTEVLDESLSTLTPEEKTIRLFPTIISMVDIITKSARPRLDQFNFFNSSGNLFSTDYKSTALNSVNVDQAGDQTFCMKFQ